MFVRYAIPFIASCVVTIAQTPTAPTIPGTIGDKAAIVGDTVQFWTGATGTPPLAYQWLKNGSPMSNGGAILGATDEVLQMSNVQRSDDALYSLRVTNAAGSATSNAAHLTVRELKIVTPPASQSVAAGGTATFSVVVSATDPITYQWYKNSHAVPGANASTLTVTNASAADVGDYNVAVTTVVNTLYSASGSLSVAAPPIISAQPHAASAVVGKSFSLYVDVTGQGPFSYQWYKNGASIAGATGYAFSTSTAQMSDGGDYYVVVSNASGATTSSTVKVTVFGLTLIGATEKVYDGLPLAVTAVSDPAGLPVAIGYSYLNSAGILAGPPVAAGSYQATASVSRSPYFGQSSVDLTIRPAPVVVTFGNLQQTYDGNPHPITATTSPGGIPIKLEYGGPNGPPPIAAGTYEVIAFSQDSNYLPTSARASLVVSKASQSLTIDAPPANAQVGTSFALAATASSGLSPITFSVVSGNASLSGPNLTVNDTNPVTIRATQAGNANYNPASADFTFGLGKQNQTISFPALANRLTSAAPETVTATASSGLPVAFAVVSGPATITGNTLTLTGTVGSVVVRATQAGNGTFNAAPAVDRSFAVTSSPAPVITSQPASQTATVWSTVTFSVAATGTGTLSYQWLKNGAPITSFNTPTFTLRNVQISDSGTFSVIVSNGDASTTSAPATLTVVPAVDPAAIPPAITGQTASQAVDAGSTAFIMVTAGGTPPLYYQWRKDGVPVAGATLDTLVISNFQAGNAGDYTVVIQNSAATITSPATTLSLATSNDTGAPTITKQPSARLVATGTPVYLDVAAKGTAPLAYQWYKDGVTIAGATQAGLTFAQGAKLADAGTYSVRVSNASGSVTSTNATLSVADPVTITSQPVGRTAVEGSLVTFTVAVGGTPPFSVNWMKGGSLINGASSLTLTLPNVKLADAGTYSAIVYNAVSGGAYSESAILTVVPAGGVPLPSITTQPAAQTVSAGATASFAVTVTGAQTYQWQKDGVNVPGATGATLIVANATSADAGSYRVLVANATGTVTSATATLTVRPPPFAGTYFGTFASGGSWALYVRPDLSGMFVGYLTATKSAVIQELTVKPDGSFSVLASVTSAQSGSSAITAAPAHPIAAAAGTLLSGTISGAQVTGQLTGLGVAFSGSIDSNSGGTAKPGYYAAATLGGTNGTTYAVVGGSGKAVVVTTSSGPVDSATGMVNASGKLSTTTVGGATLDLQIDAQAASINGSLGPVAFSGLADGVASTSRLINLSVRSTAGSGDATLAVGFVTAGTGTKQVLLRGIGPTLAQFDVVAPLAKPELQLFDASGTVVQRNSSWGGGAALIEAFNRVGAFALPNTSTDAALLVSLGTGRNTVQIAGSAGTRGVALVEAYDADGNAPTARFINMSARTESGTGAEALTVGFVVTGNAPVTVLVRGIGPGLTPFGVSGVLANPQLALFEGDKQVVSNDDWAGTDELAAAFTRVGAFSLPRTSKDSALLLALRPGAYTARVTDVSGGTGVALIEVYEVR